MKVIDYLLDPTVTVKLDGVEVKAKDAEKDLLDTDMEDKLAVHTPYGLLTVASTNPKRPGATIPPNPHQEVYQRDRRYDYTFTQDNRSRPRRY